MAGTAAAGRAESTPTPEPTATARGSSAPAPRLIASASAVALLPHQLALGSGGTAEQGDWRRQLEPGRTVPRTWLPFVRQFASLSPLGSSLVDS